MKTISAAVTISESDLAELEKTGVLIASWSAEGAPMKAVEAMARAAVAPHCVDIERVQTRIKVGSTRTSGQFIITLKGFQS